MPPRLLTLFVLVLLLPIAGHAAGGIGPKDLPKPTDYVSDLAHVLSPRAVKEVDRVCGQVDHSNLDTQIAVVTIPSLNGADIARFATDLASAWGVGGKKTGRGVLILLAVNDHEWRIAVSKGLESILTDDRAAAIGGDITPQLRANDFSDAVMQAVHEFAQALIDAEAVSRSQPALSPNHRTRITSHGP